MAQTPNLYDSPASRAQLLNQQQHTEPVTTTTTGTGITDISATRAVQNTVLGITKNTSQDGLLNNPFAKITNTPLDYKILPQVGPFINPLTPGEQAIIIVENQRIELYQKQIAMLSNEYPSELDLTNVLQNAVLGPQIKSLRSLIKLSQKIKAPFTAKYAKALRDWEEAKHQRATEQAAIITAAEEARAVDNAGLAAEFQKYVSSFSSAFDGVDLTGLSKVIRPQFERDARNYITDEPEIIFVSEYFVDQKFIGLLICFSRYNDSTHYEIFKRGIFGESAKFRRMLFLDKVSLESELNSFLPYIHNTMGFRDLQESDIFVVLDTQVQEDRIYEYSISASRVPSSAAEIDYDLILEMQDHLGFSILVGNVTLFNFANAVFATRSPTGNLAWLLSVVNEGITFFGRSAAESALIGNITNLREVLANPALGIRGGAKIYWPKDFMNFLSIYGESVSLFGLKDTFKNLLLLLGGLPQYMSSITLKCVDENAGSFSYSTFRNELKKDTPVFNLIYEIAQTKDADALAQLEQTNTILPMNEGTESITGIAGLSAVLKFINATYLALSYAQEDATFETLVNVRALIELNRKNEDPTSVDIGRKI